MAAQEGLQLRAIGLVDARPLARRFARLGHRRRGGRLRGRGRGCETRPVRCGYAAQVHALHHAVARPRQLPVAGRGIDPLLHVLEELQVVLAGPRQLGRERAGVGAAGYALVGGHRARRRGKGDVHAGALRDRREAQFPHRLGRQLQLVAAGVEDDEMRRRRRHPRQFRQDVVELDGIEPEIGAVCIPEVYRDQVVGAVLRPRDAVARVVEEADRVGVPLRQTLRKGPHLAQDVAAGGIPDDRGPEADRLQRPADRRHVVVRVLERAADLGVIGRIADQQRQTQLRVRLLTRCADPDRQRYRGRCNCFHLRPTPQGPKSPARYHAPSPGKSRC